MYIFITILYTHINIINIIHNEYNNINSFLNLYIGIFPNIKYITVIVLLYYPIGLHNCNSSIHINIIRFQYLK